MKYKVVDLNNNKVEDIEISDLIFANNIFPDLIHNYIRYQRAKNRQGSHKTKGRSEVRGKSKKPFSQKGTGNARQGSTKAPHFRGGGTAFGPVVRDHSIRLNKKERKLALKCALSEKFKKGEIVILSDSKIDSYKTKKLYEKIGNFEFKSAVFIQTKENIDKNFVLASSNIPKINFLTVDGLNIKDMLNHEKLFIFKNAVFNIQDKLA